MRRDVCRSTCLLLPHIVSAVLLAGLTPAELLAQPLPELIQDQKCTGTGPHLYPPGPYDAVLWHTFSSDVRGFFEHHHIAEVEVPPDIAYAAQRK
jgi:hypothetical protein